MHHRHAIWRRPAHHHITTARHHSRRRRGRRRTRIWRLLRPHRRHRRQQTRRHRQHHHSRQPATPPHTTSRAATSQTRHPATRTGIPEPRSTGRATAAARTAARHDRTAISGGGGDSKRPDIDSTSLTITERQRPPAPTDVRYRNITPRPADAQARPPQHPAPQQRHACPCGVMRRRRGRAGIRPVLLGMSHSVFGVRRVGGGR